MLLERDELALAVAGALLERSARVAVAETTAGGLISARLLSVAGASSWFERGAVAYSGSAKLQATGIDAETLKTHGAVSREAVSAMAEGLRANSGADFALAESGIAGPQTGRRSAKPAGSVVIAVATPGGTVVEEHNFPGSRVEVMEQISARALSVLAEAIRASIIPNPAN
jgi:PncC family amidohydrolase